MGDAANLKDYARFEFSDGHWTREVLRRGSGPAVIIIHEVPGIHPPALRFADRIDAADAAPGMGGKPHSVLTINLKDDDPEGPTKRAEKRVIEFFGQCLKI